MVFSNKKNIPTKAISSVWEKIMKIGNSSEEGNKEHGIPAHHSIAISARAPPEESFTVIYEKALKVLSISAQNRMPPITKNSSTQ